MSPQVMQIIATVMLLGFLIIAGVMVLFIIIGSIFSAILSVFRRKRKVR